MATARSEHVRREPTGTKSLNVANVPQLSVHTDSRNTQTRHRNTNEDKHNNNNNNKQQQTTTTTNMASGHTHSHSKLALPPLFEGIIGVVQHVQTQRSIMSTMYASGEYYRVINEPVTNTNFYSSLCILKSFELYSEPNCPLTIGSHST